VTMSMTDAEQIDALAYHLMCALDKNDELQAEAQELRVQNVMLRRQLEVADWNADFMEWVER
jgi:hypothetical protein